MEALFFILEIYLASLITLGILHGINTYTCVKWIDKVIDLFKKEER